MSAKTAAQCPNASSTRLSCTNFTSTKNRTIDLGSQQSPSQSPIVVFKNASDHFPLAQCQILSYLACGHELEWAKTRLQVRHVRLQVVQGICDGGLGLRWRLPRWAVWRDLVEGGRRHFCGCVERMCGGLRKVREAQIQFKGLWGSVRV